MIRDPSNPWWQGWDWQTATDRNERGIFNPEALLDPSQVIDARWAGPGKAPMTPRPVNYGRRRGIANLLGGDDDQPAGFAGLLPSSQATVAGQLGGGPVGPEGPDSGGAPVGPLGPMGAERRVPYGPHRGELLPPSSPMEDVWSERLKEDVGQQFSELGHGAHDSLEFGIFGPKFRGAGSLLEPQTPEQGAAGARLGGAAMGAAGLPFTEIVGGINAAQIAADPILNNEYTRRMSDLPPEQQKLWATQRQVAHEALDAVTAKLLRALDDPNLSDEQKRAAFAVAGGMIVQRAVELGGPWLASSLARMGLKAADIAAGRALGPASEAIETGLGRATGEVPPPTIPFRRQALGPVTRVGYRTPTEPQVPIETALGEPQVSGFGAFVRGQEGMAQLDLGIGKLFYHVSPKDIEAPAVGMRGVRYREQPGPFAELKKVSVQSKAFFMSQDPELLKAVTELKTRPTQELGVGAKSVKIYGGVINSDRVLRLDQLGETGRTTTVPALVKDLARGSPLLRRFAKQMGGTDAQALRAAERQGLLDERSFSMWLDDPVVARRVRAKYDAVVFDDLGYGRSVAVLNPQTIENFRQYVGRVHPPFGAQGKDYAHTLRGGRLEQIIAKGNEFVKGEGGMAQLDLGIGNLLAGPNKKWAERFKANDRTKSAELAEKITGVKGALTPWDTADVVQARVASEQAAAITGFNSTAEIPGTQLVPSEGLRARAADMRARPEALVSADLPGTAEEHAVFLESLANQPNLTRAQLRSAVIEHLWQIGGREYQPGTIDKTLDIWIGLPASGKSMLQRAGGLARILSADQAKLFLPEYLKGEGAGIVHEESSAIKRALEWRARSDGEAISITSVGDNEPGLRDRIVPGAGVAPSYQEIGYKVNVHYIEVDPALAASRTVERFGQTGRLVDPAKIAEIALSNGPERLYTKYGKGVADGWEKWRTGPEGPRLVESGGTLSGSTGQRQAGRLGDVVGGGRPALPGAGPMGPPERPILPTGQVLTEGKPERPTFGLEQFPTSTQDTLMRMQEAVHPAIAAARGRISFAEQNAPTIKPLWQLAAEVPKAGEVSTPTAQLRQGVADLLQATAEYRNANDAGTITPAQVREYATKLAVAVIGRVAEVGSVAESARTLGGVRMPLHEQLRMSATARAIDEVFYDLAKNDPSKLDGVAEAIARLGNEPRKIIRMMDQIAHKPDFFTRFDEYYRSNVLWNVVTHVTNTSSGLFQQALLGARETGVGLVDVATFQTSPYQFGIEEISMLRGWGQGFVQAFDMLRGVRDMLPMASDKYGGAMGFSRKGALGTPGEHGFLGTDWGKGAEGFFNLGKYYGPILRTPFKFLEAADLFQTAPMYNGLLWRNAYRMAYKEGLRGWGEIDSRAQEIIRTLPDGIDAEGAFKTAEDFALHGTGELAETIIKLRRKAPFMQPLVLFVNTPANLLKLSGKFSPLGYGRFAVGAMKKLTNQPTEIDPKEAFVEASIGSVITAQFLGMLGADNAIGLTPKSRAEAAAWQAEGRQPLSIRASEYPILGPAFRAYYGARGEDATKVWVGPALLGPLLIPYMMAAAAHEVGRNPSKDPIENQAIVAAFNAGKTFLDQVPLFSTYSTITNALDIANLDAGGRFLARLGLPLIPAESMLKMVAAWTDGFRRDPKTFDEIIRATMPFLSETVRPALDVLGRPRPGHVMPFDIGPRATEEQPADDLLMESERLRRAAPEEWSGLVKVSRNVQGEDLTYDQHTRYQELAGVSRRTLLGALKSMPEYQRLNTIQQAQAFDATNAAALREARRRLGIEMTGAAPDEVAIARGIQVALGGSSTNYDKGKTLHEILTMGKLRSNSMAAIDDARTQKDPLKPGYELSVNELLRGSDLVDKWRRQPAYVVGTPEEWKIVADADIGYSAIYAELGRMARLKGVNIKELPQYAALIRYYVEAGNGLYARYYTLAGQVRDNLISAERKAIKADPLWSSFSSQAEPKPAVPYRFPVPVPGLPSSAAPPGQQAGQQLAQAS